MQRMLESRLQRLEDIEAIRRLKALYSHYANVGEGSGDVEKFVELFTEDGEWDLSGRVLRGRAEIAERLREVEKMQYLGLHFALNPRIDVDGDTAVGDWDLAFPVVPPGAGAPTIVCGYYHDRMVRREEGWRFTYVRYRVSPPFSLTK